MEIAKVTKLESTPEIGYIYFGTYTFLMIGALLLNEVSAFLVEDVKKSKRSLPVNR